MVAGRYEVLFTAGAEQDLESIHDYIAEFDSPASAEHVLDRLMKAVDGLSTFPERGSHPKELLALGIKDYRQTFFKPYRVIYRVDGQRVYVYLIVDGRRDMQSLLGRRLLGGCSTPDPASRAPQSPPSPAPRMSGTRAVVADTQQARWR
jgi:toxin ParE1/3/4